MNNQLIKSLFAIIFVIATIQIQGQERIIHGKVTTLENMMVAGASIAVKSSGQVFYTDSLGNFSVACNEKDKLEVAAEGFYSVKTKVNKKIKYAAFNLSMIPESEIRKHAVGYGHVEEGSKQQAVSSMTDEDFDFSIYSNMYDLIKGRFPGVQVINKQVVIRGRGSTNSSGDPLVIVDGVQVGNALNNLHPSMVKNISILKDSGAAVYGTRGANGVIIIETTKQNL